MKYTDIQRLEDYTLQSPLYNIGEHAYYLSSEFKEKHSEVKWHMISGLRHRLVHDYDDTNWGLIADIIFKDLFELKEQIATIMNEEENLKNDKE